MGLDTSVTGARVDALLGSRPTSWLRPFLQLATADLGAGVSPRGWYRLGPGRPGPAGRIETPLVWWPHLEAPLFERFAGSFVVDPTPAGTRVTLEGRTWAGDPVRNRACLGALVRLLTRALEDLPPDPP